MTSTVPTGTPPAGWYPDPYGSPTLRWWDGATWSEHQAPTWQPPGGVVAQPGQDLEWLLPVNCDGFAIAAGYLGLFSLIPNPFTSTAAIICGWVSLRRMKRTRQRGKGRAVCGIVMGGLSLTIFLLVVAASANSHNS